MQKDRTVRFTTSQCHEASIRLCHVLGQHKTDAPYYAPLEAAVNCIELWSYSKRRDAVYWWACGVVHGNTQCLTTDYQGVHLPKAALAHLEEAAHLALTEVKREHDARRAAALELAQNREADALTGYLLQATTRRLPPSLVGLYVTPSGRMRVREDDVVFAFDGARHGFHYEHAMFLGGTSQWAVNQWRDHAPPGPKSLRVLAARALAQSLPSLDLASRKLVVACLFKGSEWPPAKRKRDDDDDEHCVKEARI
jgi:hypothetical protein